MATEWVTVKLSRDIINKVDQVVGKEGFTSRTEVVTQAIRDFLKTQREV